MKTKLQPYIVHALLKKKAMCLFSDKSTRRWPSRNYWVAATSKKYRSKITCAKCILKVKKITTVD